MHARKEADQILLKQPLFFGAEKVISLLTVLIEKK